MTFTRELHSLCHCQHLSTCQPIRSLSLCLLCIPILSPHMSHYTATCHFTVLTVGWLVSCYRTPLNTTLLLSALTLGICLVSHSPAGTFKSTPLSLFPYQTFTISTMKHLQYIHTNALSKMSDHKALASCVICCWLVCQTLNPVVCSYHLLCHSVLT